MCVLTIQICSRLYRIKHLKENGGFKATVLRPEEINPSNSNFATPKSAPEQSKLSHLGKQKSLETDWAKINSRNVTFHEALQTDWQYFSSPCTSSSGPVSTFS